MTPNDIERFGIAIGKLCVAFNRQADKALIEVYREVLAEKRIEDIEAAVKKYLGGTSEYMPPPGLLKKAALDAASKRNGVAWIEGTGWISTLGDPDRAFHPDLLDAEADRKRLASADKKRKLGAVG